MAHLYNVSSNRNLREGDVVRIQVGPRAGRLAKVVGVDLLNERPLVIQYSRPTAGILRECYGANEVSIYKATWADVGLDAAPNLRELLSERGLSGAYDTCGSMLCMPTRESAVVTFVPKDRLDRSLQEVLEEAGSLKEGLEALLACSFITRLPDLVDVGLGLISEKLNATGSPDQAANAILESSSVDAKISTEE